MTALFDNIYQQSIEQPEVFWGEAAKDIQWSKEPQIILDNSEQYHARWFPDGELNVCYNALDYHVENGRGEQTALIYDSPVTNTVIQFSYSEMLDQVSRVAGMLSTHGVGKGDRVIIYMPVVPEAAMAMLACARLGAIHSVVFGGFAANELAVRIDDALPKVILAASCGIETSKVIEYKPLLDDAIDIASHKPDACIILQRPQCQATMKSGRDYDWQEQYQQSKPTACVNVKADHPLYILYTSGTTGQPKGVVHDTGGYIVALKWSMKNIYDINAGDVYWAASDIGWVVGHSYMVYGPLVKGATSIFYEGKPVGTPDAGAFWRLIEQHRVKALFCAPTTFRAIKKEDPKGQFLQKYDTRCLETLYLAGERCDPDTLEWAHDLLEVPVIDHWWQTETGWPMCANCKGIELLPIIPGSPTRAVPGYDIRVVNKDMEELPANELGILVIKLPLPPGVFTGLWNNEKKFIDAYFSNFPGYYETGDAGVIDENQYVSVMSRTDDVINVAGHRLSTGAMEEVLATHPEVSECAVIHVKDHLKGQLPLGLLVLSSDSNSTEEQIVNEVIKSVRETIGPVAAFKLCAVVKRLPKTRSGKILRATMAKIADGETFKIPATIDDPASLDEIAGSLTTIGYPINNKAH